MNCDSRKILIVGTYCGLNKGDRLMQQVVIKAVSDLNMTPVLSSPFPDIDRKFYSNVKIVKCRRRNLPLSLLQCLLMMIMPKYFRQTYASKNSELKDYLEARLIIDTSGDMLTEDYGTHIALSHAIPLIYCVLLEKKFLILAQSIGPFKLLKFLYIKLLSKAEIITARDSVTFNYLEKLKLTNIVKTADLGFLVDAKKTALDDCHVLNTHNKRVVIGICPSALFFEKFSKKYKNCNLIKFCLMLDKLAKENNLSYLIVPHVMTPSGRMDDKVFSMQLVRQLNSECQIINEDLDSAQIKYIFSKLKGVISFRMHGAIAALDSLIPTIAIAYSHKTIGLYESLGISEWVINNDNNMVNNLEKAMNKLLENPLEFKSQLNNSVPVMRQQAKMNIDILTRMKL